MKTFIGYYIIGANTKEDAQNEKGLMLWSPNKPNALKRWLNEKLLGIYWVDRERVVGNQDKGKTMQSENQPVEMAKVAATPNKAQSVKKEKTEIPVAKENSSKPRQTPRIKPNKQ